jgi:HlyD family secretion protein
VRRAVKVAARGPLNASIAAGLEPGDRVVVYPSDALTDGRRVRVVRGR